MTDLADPRWLGLLVDDALASFPGRQRRGDVPAVLPADPLEAFIAPIREDIDTLVMSDAAVPHAADGAWLRAFVGSALAARSGHVALAIAADPDRPHKKSIAAVRRAFEATADTMTESGWPPADPRGGLPLRSGLLALRRAHLVRVAADHHAKRFNLARLRRRAAQTAGEAAALFETLASWLAAGGPLSASTSRLLLQQLRWLVLPRVAHRRVRAVIAAPRSPRELAADAAPALRRVLLEQLLLAEVACGADAARQVDFIGSFADACRVSREELPALRTVAAARCAATQRWLEPRATGDAEALAREWEDAAERMYLRVADAFSDNLEALVTEVRETGELGTLLGRAAAGHTLTRDERAKVKAQLIDLAKVVPALAIFAAPGGMLLLPLLSKLLPFSLLPSSWAQTKPPRLPAAVAKKTATP